MTRYLPIIGILLAGCSRAPEIKACEEYVKGALKSPSSYKLVKSSNLDDRISFNAWRAITRELGAALADEPSIVALDQKRAAEGGVRTILLEYDAANSFGTPIRGVGSCKFLMTSFANDEFQTDPDVAEASVSADRAIAAVQGSDVSADEGCCISKKNLSLIGSLRPPQ